MLKVPLTHGFVAIIDEADSAVLGPRKWHAHRVSPTLIYARRNGDKKAGEKTWVYLHRAVLGVVDGRKVDHEDGDGLNCRRDNLTAGTQKQNMANVSGPARSNLTSPFLGVSYSKRDRRWVAYIHTGERKKHLGSFLTVEAANTARLSAERELRGVAPRRRAAFEDASC